MFRYNVLSRELSEVPQLAARCELRDALYLPDRDELACRMADNTGEYIISTLAGEQQAVVTTPNSGGLRALLYVPELNAILFTEQYTTWFVGERRSRVWLHDLGNGQNSVLSDNQSLGISSVYRAD